VIIMKAKTRSTFTFQIDADVRAALDQIAATKEWTTGHLVNSILTAHVASTGKAAKRKPAKPAQPPADAEDTATPV
jgi:hypothetical protein